MTVIVSHPTGNANVRAALRGLQRAGMLHLFCTTLGLSESLLLKVPMPARLRSEASSRVFPEIPASALHRRPLRELIRQIARRAGAAKLIRHETGWASYHQVYYDLDRDVARRLARFSSEGARAVYAYEDGANASFHAAREIGMKCLYDLPSPYWPAVQEIIEQERERLPGWAGTMDALRDSDYSRNRKDEEIDGADRILVASSFSRSALRKHPNTELAVSAVPYGAPPPKVERCANKANGQPIEIVFAGRLSQSKGVADLIAALLLLDVDWHATIAGSMPQVVPTDLAAFIARKNVTYLGFVTHEVLLDTLSRAHVFVFPSLYEGFGMVLTEAMACGLPIISTPNTAAPDLITDGTEGFIVPIRDPDAIAERITRLAEDEDMRQSMAASALVLAERSPWSDYEAEIAGIVARELAL